MTRYSRSVIPGRPQGEERPSDLDRLIFGGAAGRSSAEADEDEEDDDPPPRILTDPDYIDRSRTDRRKTRRRKSDYQKLPRDTGRAPPEDNRRGLTLLVGTVAVLGVFGVVVWNAYSGGVKTANAENAPMLATAGAFKTRPEAPPPTPQRASDQASVFDRVEAPARAVERQAQPVLDQRPPVSETPVETLAGASAAQAVQAAPPPPASMPSAATPAQTMAESMAQSAPPPPRPEIETIGTAPVPGRPAPLAAPPVVQAEPAPAPVLAGGYRPAFATDGRHVVQIASVLSEDAAKAEWDRAKRAHPELLSAASSSIVRADVNGETRYRVRVAAFATPAEADAFCAALKSAGRDCFRSVK